MKNLICCPVCQCDKITPLFVGHTNRDPNDKKAWPVSRCGKCGHGFMNPQPDWDELAPYYSASYDPYEVDHGHYANSDKKTIEAAEHSGEFRHLSLPIAGKRLLDVGCGGGYFLRVAKQLGAIAQGVEPSEVGANQCKRQKLDVFHGMLEQFVKNPSNAKYFDIITANHVLEHAPEPVETLENIRKLLAPRGLIWISVPNARCYFSEKLTQHWHSTDLPYHLQQFSTESLVLAGKFAGLSVRRQYTYSLPAATAASLRYFLRKNYFVPQRLTLLLSFIDTSIAPQVAKKLDRKGLGEAIIVEFEVR